MNGRNPEMKKELVTRLHKSFEGAVHHQEGTEYWLARELQELLGYTTWRSFEQVVDKAKIACAKADVPVADHFADVGKMIELAKGAQRDINDITLTRSALYLISQQDRKSNSLNHSH